MNQALYGLYTDPTYIGYAALVAIVILFFAAAWAIYENKKP